MRSMARQAASPEKMVQCEQLLEELTDAIAIFESLNRQADASHQGLEVRIAKLEAASEAVKTLCKGDVFVSLEDAMHQGVKGLRAKFEAASQALQTLEDGVAAGEDHSFNLEEMMGESRRQRQFYFRRLQVQKLSREIFPQVIGQLDHEKEKLEKWKKVCQGEE
jgi:hypothetical protein